MRNRSRAFIVGFDEGRISIFGGSFVSFGGHILSVINLRVKYTESGVDEKMDDEMV